VYDFNNEIDKADIIPLITEKGAVIMICVLNMFLKY
jgi:hypothetical protein